jgi:hypothetical protein
VVNEAQTMLISLSDVALNPQSAGFNINPAVRPIGTAIPPLAVISPTAFASPVSSHSAFVQSVPTATTVCRSTVACINPASTILRVTMNGASGTFLNPFQRVVFYYLDAAVGWWVLIGSSATPTVTDTGNERIYSYSLFWNVSGLMTTGGQPLLGAVAVRAVGVHSSGSALVSTNTQRTITFLNN